MGNPRRLFGDLGEGIWGSGGAKWRLFGDVGEWTWGSGPLQACFRADWCVWCSLHESRLAVVPHKVSQLRPPNTLRRDRFPKDSHSCSGSGSAYFAHSSNLGTLAEIRRIEATRGNIDSRSEHKRICVWQPGCHASALPSDVAADVDRHASNPGAGHAGVEHGRANPRAPVGAGGAQDFASLFGCTGSRSMRRRQSACQLQDFQRRPALGAANAYGRQARVHPG